MLSTKFIFISESRETIDLIISCLTSSLALILNSTCPILSSRSLSCSSFEISTNCVEEQPRKKKQIKLIISRSLKFTVFTYDLFNLYSNR